MNLLQTSGRAFPTPFATDHDLMREWAQSERSSDEPPSFGLHRNTVMRWNAASPLQRAKATLAAGDYVQARALVAEALQNTPHDQELHRFAQIIAPPRVLAAKKAVSSEGQAANRLWLRQNSADYAGQWVALRDGQLLAAAPDLSVIQEQLGSVKGIFLTRIF